MQATRIRKFFNFINSRHSSGPRRVSEFPTGIPFPVLPKEVRRDMNIELPRRDVNTGVRGPPLMGGKRG
jgi:hypothetical protein